AADHGEVYRLDRQPTMANHPVTPIAESDLRRHLAAQTDLRIGAVHWPSYTADLASVVTEAGSAVDVLILDALTDAHLHALAPALTPRFHRTFDEDPISPHFRPLFMLGSGGLSRVLGL